MVAPSRLRGHWFRFRTSGFALPTVLIASIVLLTVLTVSVSATTAVREALDTQYYDQLAQVAGDAGVAYAKACLASNGNVPLWSNAKPLTPATDCSGNPLTGSASVQALVVAGGGGGGSGAASAANGGGGGGGGVIYNSSLAVGVQSYSITVGGGGAANTNGSNSSIGSLIVATGGGKGGGLAPLTTGGSGGSGGGGSSSTSGASAGGLASPTGQGFNGGSSVLGSPYPAGGGGGAGQAGGTTATGNGGAGLAYSISGSSVYYSGGGGGAADAGAGAGGIGGGGNGVVYTSGTGGAAGTANTGGGGGGGASQGASIPGGAGGSGVVIISYPTGSLTVSVTGAATTTSGGNTIQTFTTSGTFNVTANNTTISCPSDSRCAVTKNGDVVSSFSVGLPTLDANGLAVTIPNSGYVNLLRSSNGVVWKTYTQPGFQAAVVPDLCSGTATAALGWSAPVTYAPDSIFPDSTAKKIALTGGNAINPGQIYFRKDFSVTKADTYVIQAKADDASQVNMDGNFMVATTDPNSVYSQSVQLGVGCHTLFVKVTNLGIVQNASNLTISLKGSTASSPTVVTDSSWRVSTGNAVQYSSPSYFEDTSAWVPVHVFGVWSIPSLPWGGGPASWNSYSGDNLTNYINTPANISGNNYPAASYTWLRNTQGFNLTTAADIKFSAYCDDSCLVYMDGTQIMNEISANGLSTQTISVPAGTHNIGIQLLNTNTVANPSAALFSGVRVSDGAVLIRSDASWDATNFWSTTASNYYSYDNNFSSNPPISKTAQAAVLVVAGGGGASSVTSGGGGGGGGVVYVSSKTLSAQSYLVTVGSGGAASTNGVNGGNSVFGNVIAIGGGGGSYADGLAGGSGGGSGRGGASTVTQGVGTLGQGFNGGTAGIYSGQYANAGGGGAGAAGGSVLVQSPGTSGAGGIGVANSISGTSTYYGGGGGGGGDYGCSRNLAPGAGGLGGGGTGGNSGNGIGTAGTPNTGGGGGGGTQLSNCSTTGTGGIGGSGIVIISYPTGSMVTTGGTVTTSGSNTIVTFTSSGTFRILSIP